MNVLQLVSSFLGIGRTNKLSQNDKNDLDKVSSSIAEYGGECFRNIRTDQIGSLQVRDLKFSFGTRTKGNVSEGGVSNREYSEVELDFLKDCAQDFDLQQTVENLLRNSSGIDGDTVSSEKYAERLDVGEIEKSFTNKSLDPCDQVGRDLPRMCTMCGDKKVENFEGFKQVLCNEWNIGTEMFNTVCACAQQGVFAKPCTRLLAVENGGEFCIKNLTNIPQSMRVTRSRICSETTTSEITIEMTTLRGLYKLVDEYGAICGKCDTTLLMGIVEIHVHFCIKSKEERSGFWSVKVMLPKDGMFQEKRE